MSPFEQVKAEYVSRIGEEGWARGLEACLRQQYVLSTPDFFVIAEAVIAEGRGRCWYIEAMAGDMAKALGFLPYDLPWLAFCRRLGHKRPEIRFYRLETIKRMILSPRTSKAFKSKGMAFLEAMD